MSAEISQLLEQAQDEQSDGQEPSRIILGTQWEVECFDGYVLKSPRNPDVDKADVLHSRHLIAMDAMNDQYYHPNNLGDVPVPPMIMLPDNSKMVQLLSNGDCLADLSNEQLAGLPTDVIQALIHLLNASLVTTKKNGKLNDFPDLPGYNFKLRPDKRFIAALQARQSINILVGNQVDFVDPDLYFASCRNWLTKTMAWLMKPIMFQQAVQFRKLLNAILIECGEEPILCLS